MLQNGLYLYEYFDSWEWYDETLPVKKGFYSNLTKEGNTGADYKRVKKSMGIFWIQNLDQYHDLQVQSSKLLLLADVFESCQNKCTEIYELELTWFFVSTQIGMAGVSKENKCWTSVTNRCQSVINSWKRYQR